MLKLILTLSLVILFASGCTGGSRNADNGGGTAATKDTTTEAAPGIDPSTGQAWAHDVSYTCSTCTGGPLQ